MDGCNVLPETKFVGTRLRVDTTRVLSVGGSLPPCGAAGERSEINIKSPLGAPLLIFPRGYLLKSFPQVDTSARQRGLEIRVFPLLGELPKAIEPHQPVCQSFRWQLGPNMWSSPTTKSLRPWSAANRLHGQRTGAFSWRPVLGLFRKTDQFRLDPSQNCAPGWRCDRESSVYHLALEMYSGIFRHATNPWLCPACLPNTSSIPAPIQPTIAMTTTHTPTVTKPTAFHAQL